MVNINNFFASFFDRKKIKLVTHPHNFHLDDVFACASLILLLEKKGDPFEIIRTRDKEELERYKLEARDNNGSVFIFDVGGDYDEENNLFDHHQKEGALDRENGVGYSSFGLVWKKYGKEICDSEEVSQKLDYYMVIGIDANDTGFNLSEPIYDFSLYGLPLLKNSFFPISGEKKDFDDAFLEVVDIAKRVLKNEISWSKKRISDEKKFEEIFKNSQDKRVIWIEDNLSVGKCFPDYPEILLLVKKKNDGTRVIISVLDSHKSKESKIDMPAEWGGLDGKKLEEVSGISGAKFCHRGLWICAAENRLATEKMVEKILKNVRIK